MEGTWEFILFVEKMKLSFGPMLMHEAPWRAPLHPHQHCITKSLQGTISFSLCLLLHAYLIETGSIRDIYFTNLVLSIYGKLGLMQEADSLFHSIPNPNVVSWNTLMACYIHYGDVDRAATMFSGIGRTRNVVTWNTLIAGYAHKRSCKETMILLHRMHQESKLPNHVTFISMLSGCGKPEDLDIGKVIHLYINGSGAMSGSRIVSKSDFISKIKIGTSLVNMYGKCGDLLSAHRTFGELNEHDVVSWTALICTYSQLGRANDALTLFRQMKEQGSSPNKLTLIGVLSAISNVISLAQGKQVHVLVILNGFNLDVDIASALINMYGKCGNINEAWLVFESVDSRPLVVWNAIIVACLDQKHYFLALLLFKEMLLKSLIPNEYTFASALAACTCLMDLSLATLIYSYIVEEGYMPDVVINNALINLYGKFDQLENAEYIFEKMSDRSEGTWACMITVYSQRGEDRNALELFYDMLSDKPTLSYLTTITALNACADFTTIDNGRVIHTWIVIDEILDYKIDVVNSLMNMYGKCGDFADVYSVFDHLHTRNVVSWNTMMATYAQGGYGKQALECFVKILQGEDIKPDEFSYVSLLSSLSHAGMVDEGVYCFICMVSNQPSLMMPEHYVCMVDIFGRAGQSYQAVSLICNLPILPDTSLWSALLASCRMSGCKELTTYSVECILELDSDALTFFVESKWHYEDRSLFGEFMA